MRILISADMEGTAGIADWVQVTTPETAQRMASTVEYERGRVLMTEEVNAAIAGAYDAGAEYVIVTDAHGGKRNLLPDLIDRRAEFVSGSDNQLGMMQAIDEGSYDGVIFTGYHAKAGTPGAPLAHTSTGWIQDLRFDGLSVGEYGLNALLAGHFGAPVVFISGDEKAVDQARSLLGAGLPAVVTKLGYSTSSARHESVELAREAITGAIRESLQDAVQREAYDPRVLRYEIDLDHQRRADSIAYLPGLQRAGERTVVCDDLNPLEFCILWRAILAAGGAA